MSKINKAKYKRFDHKKGRKSLDINMKGFLCSCNNREKECIAEAYNILNKYADTLKEQQTAEQELNEAHHDVQDNFSKELFNLKAEANFKLFQLIDSGAKNLLFFKTSVDNTVELATSIVSDIQVTRIQQTKYLIRLVPIETTCKAYIKDIEIAVKTLAIKYFMKEAKTFSIAYNHRNNNNLNRDEVIKCIADVIYEIRPDNKVDLKLPQVVIVVEIIKGVALLSIIPNYIQYKKFNLLALSEQNDVSSQTMEVCDEGS